jgi:hypothetical protein
LNFCYYSFFFYDDVYVNANEVLIDDAGVLNKMVNEFAILYEFLNDDAKTYMNLSGDNMCIL